MLKKVNNNDNMPDVHCNSKKYFYTISIFSNFAVSFMYLSVDLYKILFFDKT